MTDHQPTFCAGGCACGAARYQVSSAPLIVHACHCHLCQRQTGSSNAVNALIEADRITMTSGEVEALVLETPSGCGQRVVRCTTCKTALWSNYQINQQGDHLRFLRVGTLDDPGLMPPDVHIFTRFKQAWYVIDKDAQAEQLFYHHDSTWSESSLRRLRALCDISKAPYPTTRSFPAAAVSAVLDA